jgi:hypothetical protein
VIDTVIDQIVLEGGEAATINVEYHLIGGNSSAEDSSANNNSDGFNFNDSRGLFTSFKFRQDPRVNNAGEGLNDDNGEGTGEGSGDANDIPLFNAKVDTGNKWLNYVQDDRFHFRSVAGGNNANTETRGIGITCTRNAFLGVLATESQKVSLGRAGLHMVSDAIFSTPLALAGIANDNAIEREIERDFCTNLQAFFNNSNDRATTSNYSNGGEGLADATFEHFIVDGKQHKVMKYVFDQLRTQAPERFTQAHYNDHSNGRDYWVNGEGAASGSGQYDPLSRYEHFPFLEGDKFVMFMRPTISNIESVSFGNNNYFAGGEGELVTIGNSTALGALDSTENIGTGNIAPSYYTNAQQYLAVTDTVNTSTSQTTGGTLPKDGDNDGLLMAIELIVNQDTVTDVLDDPTATA